MVVTRAIVWKLQVLQQQGTSQWELQFKTSDCLRDTIGNASSLWLPRAQTIF
eukprot:m.144348 g.144348  ORF g.144348 m.144348 type:complete len:52 (+) comp14123_c0_seq3:867-1022(+)